MALLRYYKRPPRGPLSEAHKAKIAIANTGKKHSPETRKKLREAKREYFARGGKPSRLGSKWSASMRKALSGSNHWNWKGGRHHSTFGYAQVYMPEHPRAIGNYILEHRLVMEKHLGRMLESFETIHHRNGIKDDNRIENLEIKVRGAHHGIVRCPYCLKEFRIP